jgi:hypothetical protein
MLRDTRCLLPANALCQSLEPGDGVVVKAYLLNGTFIEEDGATFLDRLRDRLSGNSFRPHRRTTVFHAETMAIQAMASRACIGRQAFPLKPMELKTGWFGLGTPDDVVSFEVFRPGKRTALKYVVYPPDCISLHDILTTKVGKDYLFDQTMLMPLLQVLDTLKELADIEHVHFQVSLDSIYYSPETRRFYLGHWEHLCHKLDARSLFYQEDASLEGRERTNVIRSKQSHASKPRVCLFVSPLDPPSLETIFINPYNRCLARLRDADDKNVRNALFICVDALTKDPLLGFQNGRQSTAFYKQLLDSTEKDVADHVSAYLISNLDLYSFMMVLRMVQTLAADIKLHPELAQLMSRTLDPYEVDPVKSFGEAYDAYIEMLRTMNRKKSRPSRRPSNRI